MSITLLMFDKLRNWYYNLRYRINPDYVAPGDTEDISYKLDGDE